MPNVYAWTQRVTTEFGKVKIAMGHTDIVVWMPDTIYVMELKVNDIVLPCARFTKRAMSLPTPLMTAK